MITLGGKKYATPKEVADAQGVALSTVYNWCILGKVVILGDEDVPIGFAWGSKYLIDVGSLPPRPRKVYVE